MQQSRTFVFAFLAILLWAAIPLAAQPARALRVSFSDLPAQGLGTAFVTIDGGVYLVLAAYENGPQANRWTYRVSTDLTRKELGFGLPRTAEGVGWEAQGAGVATANLDANPRPELFLMAYDNPPGPNSFRYRVGWNMDPQGRVERWSGAITAPGVSDEAQGAGIDIDQLDNDPRPDMVVGAYDSTPEGDDFFYRIGYNLRPDGAASSWSDRKTAPGVGWEADGMGLEVVRDSGGAPHLLLMAYDDPSGGNFFRYRLGLGLTPGGDVDRWGGPVNLLGLGDLGEGAAVAIYDGPKRGSLERYSAVVAAFDPNPRGRYREARLYAWQLAGDGEPRDLVAFSEHLPTCSSSALDDMRFVETRMQGAAYTDGRGSFIGRYAAMKRPYGWWGKNWYPLDQHRHSLCGILDHYNFFQPPIDVGDDEADFNSFFLPSDPFAFLISDALQASLSDWHRCGSKYCMEGEVTPAWAYESNPWFPMTDKASSVLEGREICTYGPWVREEAHNFRPEIHPSEAYWWGDGDELTMLLLRDNSRRYSQPDYFEDAAGRDASWQPWARRPLWGTFRVPFSTTLDGDWIYDLTFYAELEPSLSGGLVTATLPDAGADGTADGRLTVDGKPVLLVHEILTRDLEDHDLGVTISDLCLSDARTRLRGYLDLTVGVLEDEGGAGRATLKLTRPEGAGASGQGASASSSRPFLPKATASEPPGSEPAIKSSLDRGPLRLALVPGSLRAERAGKQPQLVGDFLLAGSSGRKARGATLTAGGSRRPLDLTKTGEAPRIQAVPVTRSGRIEIAAEGEARTVALHGLRIAPAVESQRFERYPGGGRGLPFARRIGLAPGSLPRSLRLTPVRSVEIQLAPAYVPERNGEAMPEDSSAVSKELTAILLEHPDRRKSVFGSEAPVTASWTVTLEDLQTGARREVSAAAAREHGIVLHLPATLSREPLQVSFSPDVPPTRVLLEARFQDTLAHEGTFRHELWSHVVEGPASAEAFTRESLGLVWPDAAPAALGEALSPARTIPLDPARDTLRPARLVGTYARSAVDDGMLDPGEIERLVQLATKAGSGGGKRPVRKR